MIPTDPDIAEIVERFREKFVDTLKLSNRRTMLFWETQEPQELEDFITRECLALKKKWEREHFDNQ